MKSSSIRASVLVLQAVAMYSHAFPFPIFPWNPYTWGVKYCAISHSSGSRSCTKIKSCPSFCKSPACL